MVYDMGHVVRFYTVERETEKTMWLQEIGSKTVDSVDNSEHGWEVEPEEANKIDGIIQKRKNKHGLVKMAEYKFLREYDPSIGYQETNF